MLDWDVVVAGAGPAGVSCALALVKRMPSLKGRLLVLDRARFPRSKPCGGGLTGHADEAMAALGLELTVPFVAAPHARVTFGSLQRDVRLQRPVRIVRREDFDASLVEQARDHGVEVREGAPLEGFRRVEDHVELGAGGKTLTARVLVGADGVGSLVRKELHGSRRKAAPEAARETPIRLFRLELEARGRWLPDTMLYDFTGMSDGLRGYVWIFPSPGGRLNVGLMHAPTVGKSGAELTALLAERLRPFGVTLDGERVRGWPAWGYLPSVRVAGANVLLCGDAAGIDALTGEGIAVGMEQGLVCAESITDAFARGDFSFRRHALSLRRATVGRELNLDRWLARMLYGSDGGWRRWLSLVLCDDRMLDLYAQRVCGSLVLSDHKRELAFALVRHLLRSGERRRRLSDGVALEVASRSLSDGAAP